MKWIDLSYYRAQLLLREKTTGKGVGEKSFVIKPMGASLPIAFKQMMVAIGFRSESDRLSARITPEISKRISALTHANPVEVDKTTVAEVDRPHYGGKARVVVTGQKPTEATMSEIFTAHLVKNNIDKARHSNQSVAACVDIDLGNHNEEAAKKRKAALWYSGDVPHIAFVFGRNYKVVTLAKPNDKGIYQDFHIAENTTKKPMNYLVAFDRLELYDNAVREMLNKKPRAVRGRYPQSASKFYKQPEQSPRSPQ